MSNVTQSQWDDWLSCLESKRDLGLPLTDLREYVKSIALQNNRHDIYNIVDFHFGNHQQNFYTNGVNNEVSNFSNVISIINKSSWH